jgi:acyl-coenzyme A thioesterase PaaI-like protein
VSIEGVDIHHHVVADMDVATLLVARDRCVLVAPLVDAVRSPHGGASLGMLVTLADLGASDPALASCRPDWTATMDLSIHAATPIVDGPIVVDCRLLRVGKKVIAVGAEVFDGHGEHDLPALVGALDRDAGAGGARPPTPAATGIVTFARLPGTAAAGVDDYDPGRWLGEVRRRVPDDGAGPVPEGSMYERMGLRVVDAPGGSVELDRTGYVINSIGTINGGAQAILVEAAAEAAVPGLVATDVQVHYLAQVGAGPARTASRVLRRRPDHAVVDVRVVDAGRADLTVALATVTLQAPPG